MRHDKMLVPDQVAALHAHRSRFCLRARAEGQGLQIENRETHTGIALTCQYLVAQLEWGKCPACQRPVHDNPVIKGIMPPILATAFHQCVQNTAPYLWLKTISIIMTIIQIIKIMLLIAIINLHYYQVTWHGAYP